MIEGLYIGGRPQVSGLLVFPTLSGLIEIPITFVVDTGADRSLIAPNEYEDYFSYQDSVKYPLSDSSGFGASIFAHLVPCRLSLRHTGGAYSFHPLIVELLKPQQPRPMAPLPSVLGRDILDQFRFLCDRTTGTVALDEVANSSSLTGWPDEDTTT